MFKGIHFPQKVEGARLDAYLSRGWYRIGQLIFTTDHIPHSTGNYRVFWLRYDLQKLRFGKKQHRLLDANEKFDVEIKPFELTGELEMLYQDYLSGIRFEASPSLRNCLYDYGIIDDPGHNVFDSRLIEVRDQGRLIAAGIFDMGKNSLAGIVNFFHPDYRKYSPGKWLMLLKIRYAQVHRLKFYYPGYIACDYPKFDYKLFPGPEAAEIYEPLSMQWLPYDPGLMKALRDKTEFPAPEE